MAPSRKPSRGTGRGNRDNALFVCSKNQWRSPTAEKVYRNDQRINVRSCGTSKAAVRSLSASDIQWASIIFVMEKKHKQFIQTHYSAESKYTAIHVLDIPDDYRFMDPDLVEIIQQSVEPFLENVGQ